ncbi:MAG: 3-phosphoglycerate dehydrogenase, partial [Clostridia bacterium]|nr:3-phosphoglycerate dehydrogenase [Clostridia bacterium]
TRLVILHKNIANILAQITTAVANEGINISNLSNQSRGEYAVTILDIDQEASDSAISHISTVSGIIKVRVIK